MPPRLLPPPTRPPTRSPSGEKLDLSAAVQSLVHRAAQTFEAGAGTLYIDLDLAPDLSPIDAVGSNVETIVSSLLEAPIPANIAVFGEVGLAGEVRAVDMARGRVSEASKFGFTKCILPKSCAADVRDVAVELLPVTGVTAAIDLALDR